LSLLFKICLFFKSREIWRIFRSKIMWTRRGLRSTGLNGAQAISYVGFPKIILPGYWYVDTQSCSLILAFVRSRSLRSGSLHLTALSRWTEQTMTHPFTRRFDSGLLLRPAASYRNNSKAELMFKSLKSTNVRKYFKKSSKSKNIQNLSPSLSRAPRHDVRFYNFFNFCKIFLEIICY